MILNRTPNPFVLVAVGLLGLSAYAVILRLPHPALLSNDLIRGIWYGFCIGLEILGLILLRRARGRKSM